MSITPKELRRIADDQEASGREATASDYRNAADTIEDQEYESFIKSRAYRRANVRGEQDIKVAIEGLQETIKLLEEINGYRKE